MNINNIHKIMNSNLWKRIIRNKNYRGYTILDQYNKPGNHRISGQMFLLLVFFEAKVSDIILKRWLIEGRNMSLGEGLDSPEPYRFYGTIKMMRFS